jgi:hypothetical protein
VDCSISSCVRRRRVSVASTSLWSLAGSSPKFGSSDGRRTVDTARLDKRAWRTPQSPTSILSYISSCLASCFSNISCEASFTAARMKSKSLTVSTVYILVKVALDFFREEGFLGEIFLFFKGSTSSLGGVTFPFFCSYSLSLTSSTFSSSPRPSDTEVVFSDAFLKSWTSSVFFLLLGPGVSCSL